MAPGRVVVAAERKPDYFIGSTGRPVLTASLSHFTTTAKKPMHPSRSGSGGRTEDDHRWGGGTRTTKLSKHLHNLTIRNGAPINGKAESDITTPPPAIVNATGRRCSKSPPVSSGPAYDADDRRRRRSSSSGWHTAPLSSDSKTGSRSLGGQRGQQHQQQQQQLPAAERNRSLTSPAPRLLSVRGAASFSRPTDAPNSQHSLVLQQQCRYSNHHKQLDNRLGYQRSYDRNTFGYDQRMDQFVLPPLQI